MICNLGFFFNGAKPCRMLFWNVCLTPISTWTRRIRDKWSIHDSAVHRTPDNTNYPFFSTLAALSSTFSRVSLSLFLFCWGEGPCFVQRFRENSCQTMFSQQHALTAQSARTVITHKARSRTKKKKGGGGIEQCWRYHRSMKMNTSLQC